MVREERMRPDLLCPVDSEALCRVASEKPCQDAARLRANVVAEDERIVQDLLIHVVGVLCGRGFTMKNYARAVIN